MPLFGHFHFRPYLYGRKFHIFTDHRPLVWLINCKDPSSRLVRWRLKLEEFDYDISYKPGNQNRNADALSRVRIDLKTVPNSDEIDNKINIKILSSSNIDNYNKFLDSQDDEFNAIIDEVDSSILDCDLPIAHYLCNNKDMSRGLASELKDRINLDNLIGSN